MENSAPEARHSRLNIRIFLFFFEGEERQREGIDNSSINTVSDLPGIVLVGNID